jgi:hypothetical protein
MYFFFTVQQYCFKANCIFKKFVSSLIICIVSAWTKTLWAQVQEFIVLVLLMVRNVFCVKFIVFILLMVGIVRCVMFIVLFLLMVRNVQCVQFIELYENLLSD